MKLASKVAIVIIFVSKNLKCYLCSLGKWNTSGDDDRSRRLRLPADTSPATYLHRDVRYLHQTHGRVIPKSFVMPGHHGPVKRLVMKVSRLLQAMGG